MAPKRATHTNNQNPHVNLAIAQILDLLRQKMTNLMQQHQQFQHQQQQQHVVLIIILSHFKQ